ncbi:unnamed protein product [Schistosoma turkestanicum]|nr:unnamed protein product [Schistosoma turkestanicum]
MTEDVCRNSKIFISKSLDFILTNSQLFTTNTNTMNNFFQNHDNVSTLILNEYIKNLTEKLIELQASKQQLFICNIIHLLWMYIPPIIFIFGSLGNILSFVILKHPSTGSVTTFVYLIARSIVDEMVLTVGLLRRWTDKIFDTKFENTSNFLCKMIHFWGTSSSLLSVWLTVTLTAERALVVSFPLHVTRLISYSRVRNIIIIMSILCATLSLHFLFTVGITPHCLQEFPKSSSSLSSQLTTEQTVQMNLTKPYNSHNTQIKCFYQCSILPQYSPLNWYWSTFDAILYSYLPFCLIFGFNVIILKSVYRANKERKRLRVYNCSLNHTKNVSSSPTPSLITSKSLTVKKSTQINETNPNVRQLTIVLLIISFSFLFTTFSIVLIKILAQVLDLRGTSKLNARIYFRLADTIAELFMYINHAMNFYLFCATGKTFRKHLILLFNRCRHMTLPSNKTNTKNNPHFICSACKCCYSVYFTSSFDTTNNNKISNKIEVSQIETMKTIDRTNYKDVVVTLNSQGLYTCDMNEMNAVPGIQDISTTTEIMSDKLYTPLLNNSCNVFIYNNNDNNIENNHDYEINDNYKCLSKSCNKFYSINNNHLSSTVLHSPKILLKTLTYHHFDKRKPHQHHKQQQQEHDESDVEDDKYLEMYFIDTTKHSNFKSCRRQTSKESLQTV